MYYFHYHTLWQRYFENLGFKVVVSPPTNKQILGWGLSSCVDGACLAVKSLVGHSQALVKQGVELLFVPKIVSVSRREYTCANFLGLPDLLRQYLPASVSILSPTIDARKNTRTLRRSYLSLGMQFASSLAARRAWRDAAHAQHVMEQSAQLQFPVQGKLKILVLGPRYLIDDPYLSNNLCGHLQNLGAAQYTAGQVPEEASVQLVRVLAKPLFWSDARRSASALEHFIQRIDGVIKIAPFGCGAESFASVLIARRACERQVAMLDLIVDEHTSEVGMITRLEAFCDLLERKKSG